MTKRMLIDATHAEETRVVVLDGNRLEDFDVETAAKKQLKGNIYLAKVVRVEPSLQAAFVEYGGGRHGFLAFGEIHPDYYQIPVADRQRLLELQEAEARAEEEADDAAAAADEAQFARQARRNEAAPARGDAFGAPTIEHDSNENAGDRSPDAEEVVEAGGAPGAFEPQAEQHDADGSVHAPVESAEPPLSMEERAQPATQASTTQAAAITQDFIAAREELNEAQRHADEVTSSAPAAESSMEFAPEASEPVPHAVEDLTAQPDSHAPADAEAEAEDRLGDDHGAQETAATEPQTHAGEPREGDTRDDEPREGELGESETRDDEAREDEPREARAPARFMRSYKIQEVIRRRQILLIQVVKEERGSKGAALTTYISLAGRFSVLMPNSPRGGGISRKITSAADRRRLKEVTSALQIPRGMGLIVRTAGANRPKAEITRDCEYLLELWDSIRETTMASMAPALIHEEASLIKRAIRDNYSRDVDEVLVDGEAGWRAARDFMRMLMPAHARKVILWQDPQPLFAHNQVEAQLDAMLVPTVQLKSGGYLVINQTEALVAIDVNSGRSTRERGIEETALKTNMEAADEVARQLRLRDLAGLIVIDFIDMEIRRNNAAVEKRMKDALKDDRARIQLGSISSFGLMELSRQRLRPSLAETSFTPCPHCGGTGHVRATETSALAVLRTIEDEGAKRRSAEILVHVAGAIALYILNHKRVRVAEIEARYGMSVAFAADESLLPPETRIERLRAHLPGDSPAATPIATRTRPVDAEDEIIEEDDVASDSDDEAEDEAAAPARASTQREGAASEDTDESGRKRRRRRRGGRREDGDRPPVPAAVQPGDAPQDDEAASFASSDPEVQLGDALEAAESTPGLSDAEIAGEEEARSRRRGRRGGRRRRREPGEAGAEPSAEQDNSEEQPSSFDGPEPSRPTPPPYQPAYTGPTPADPFGGGAFDIYDVMEQAEARAAAPLIASALPVVLPPLPFVPAPAESVSDEHGPEAHVQEAHVPEAHVPEAHVPEAHGLAEGSQVEAAPVELLAETPAHAVAPRPDVEGEMAEASIPAVHDVQPPAQTAQPVTATPPVPPTLIGGEPGDLAAATEKKRGWWRR